MLETLTEVQRSGAVLPQPGPPPPRAPATYVPVPVPVFSWTGIYIGVNGGYAFGDSNWTSPTGTAFVGPPTFGAPCTTNCSTGNFGTSGYLAGGTIGGNYQWGQFVLGVEGDWDYANLNGTTFSTNGGCNLAGCETKSDWLATARVRVGYAFDRFLVYGTGGGAFGNLEASAGGLPFQQLDADRLDRRRGRRIRLHAELDRQGRVPLRRSREPSLWRCVLLQRVRYWPGYHRHAHRERRPRRHQLQVLVTGLGSEPAIRQSNRRAIQALFFVGAQAAAEFARLCSPSLPISLRS